jgi:nitroreductase
MINSIKSRRAHREFLGDPISEEKLQEIIKAGMFAPSANAKYPWELIVVKENQTKELLSKATPWSTFAKDASVIIVVIGNETESSEWIEDCSIVAEHIWLEATAQELGACWVQIRNQSNAEADVKEILNIPEDYRVLCLIPIGIPAKTLPEHEESDIDKSKIKYEKYK